MSLLQLKHICKSFSGVYANENINLSVEKGEIHALLGENGADVYKRQVPTYVEYGAADIGVTGKDIILEEGRKLYEVMDLGFGKCRMCVCGPESARELLQNNQLIRVATKYPNIAKDYFYNKKHQTVEIIKLNGSIELAPIVGLSEVIVDIVETGSTLRENGLNVLEEVCPLSARMVVNLSLIHIYYKFNYSKRLRRYAESFLHIII